MIVSAADYKKAWNERVGTATAHLDLSYFMHEGENRLYDIFEHFVRDAVKWSKDTVLVDYGCGGGWLGRYLLNKKVSLKKYVGLDISSRSIAFAKCNIENKKVDFVEIDPYEYTLKEYAPSVIVSLSVFQHMPTIEVVDKALKEFNESGAQTIILQLREGKENTFAKAPYKTTHDINIANSLTTEHIQTGLSNYDMSDITKYSNYTYLRFERLKDDK